MLVLLSACATSPTVTCNTPYILVGLECCLDNDANAVCDRDEGLVASGNGSCPELDCSLCPATIVEKNVTIDKTVYVCDKTQEVVEDPADCEGNKAHNAFEYYTPYTNAENRSGVELFTTRAACRDSVHAVEIHFRTVNNVKDLTIQAKQAIGEDWEDMGVFTDLSTKEDYVYGAICVGRCTPNAGFFLDPNKVHLIRAKFTVEENSDVGHSNEYIVDTREESDYMIKLC